METLLDSLFTAQHAEELALLATGAFTVLFQAIKGWLPERGLLPVSFVVGAAIGILGAWYSSESVTVAGYVLQAMANAAIPTGLFKAGQYAGGLFSKRVEAGSPAKR